MDFKEMYRRKLTSPAEAVKLVKDGSEVWVGIAVPIPVTLVNALLEREDEVRDITINTVVSLYPQIKWGGQNRDSNIKIDCGYPVVGRDKVQNGDFTLTPSRFWEMPRVYTDPAIRPMNVVMTMVAPMDKHGYFCMGLGADGSTSIARHAAQRRREGDDRFAVLVQVNNNVPRTRGENFLHISEVDAIIEQDQVLASLPDEPITDEEMTIGHYCAEFVKDGSTIQLGIGGIPNAVAKVFLEAGVHDLGIHSEMACDTMCDLAQAGIVTNRRKNFMPYKSIFTFAMGSQRLYDWIDDNPGVEFYPVNFVNDPHIIGQNDNLVSINACLEIDLTGQICSESIGWRQMTHPGGQIDFVEGAFRSKGGASIIATQATATPSNGGGQRISKIVPNIAPGGIITTPRSCSDYVITEYGVAHIKGQSIRQRVASVINIAHPDYRDELRFEARRRNLI